jgi:hypothetical protein
LRPEQSSIFQCSTFSLQGIDPNVNYLVKLCFKLARRPVTQAAVQTLMIVIDLDLLEDLTPRFSLGGEELTIRKRLRFQRTNKRLGFGIIVTISTDAHAHLRLNSNKGTKCDMASSPNPFCTLRFVSLD